jgi:hypothetical protein
MPQFDDRPRPEGVCRDVVGMMLVRDADGEAGHAHFRDHVADVARIQAGGDGRTHHDRYAAL